VETGPVETGPVETGPERTVRWRMLVAYDGSAFHGFAVQPEVPTVAGALAAALARATRAPAPMEITCAGRTDTGVHARGQVIHVDLPAELPLVRAAAGAHAMAGGDLARSLNRQLAPHIVVRAAEPAPVGFDARRSATARRYRYLVWNAARPDPLLAPFTWHVSGALDLRAMSGAADALLGEHDFRAFCRRAPGTGPEQPIIRRVLSATWSEVSGAESADALSVPWPSGDHSVGVGSLLRFEIEAGSFCHQMVRSVAAALVAVGQGKSNAASLLARLRSGTREGAVQPAPPHGLCLVAVSYG